MIPYGRREGKRPGPGVPWGHGRRSARAPVLELGQGQRVDPARLPRAGCGGSGRLTTGRRLATVMAMSPPGLLTLLLTLAVFWACGPAWAHSPFEPGTEAASQRTGGTAESDRRGGEDRPDRELAAVSEAPGIPWPALAVAVAALTLGWKRPRRAAGLALVLLLAVFAFEDGLHSVHHGLDQAQASSCAVAAAGANLSATAVDGVASCDVILALVSVTVEASPSDSIASFASSEHGRAPPRSLV